MWRWFKLREHERGFLFRGQDFVGFLKGPKLRPYFDPLRRLRLDRTSTRQARIEHPDLRLILKSENGKDFLAEAEVHELKDHERALVRVDNRIDAVLGPGLYAFWKDLFHTVRVEKIEASDVCKLLFEHDDLAVILSARGASELLEEVTVPLHHVGLFFKNGMFDQELSAGRYAFWRGEGGMKVVPVDRREQVADISGQELLTSDDLLVRADAMALFRVSNAEKAVTQVRDYVQVVNRQILLAIKDLVSSYAKTDLLAKKEEIRDRVKERLTPRMEALGIDLRDVILSSLGTPPRPSAPAPETGPPQKTQVPKAKGA